MLSSQCARGGALPSDPPDNSNKQLSVFWTVETSTFASMPKCHGTANANCLLGRITSLHFQRFSSADMGVLERRWQQFYSFVAFTDIPQLRWEFTAPGLKLATSEMVSRKKTNSSRSAIPSHSSAFRQRGTRSGSATPSALFFCFLHLPRAPQNLASCMHT